MRIAWDNLIDYIDCTITAGSEASDLPASNVAHPQRTRVYRTGTSSADEWVKFDLGAAKAVQCVIILDHDLTVSDSSIALQGNATDSWGSPSVDEAITFNGEVMAKFLGSAQTYRYWRVAFTKSAAGETRDIGRIFVGPFDEMTRSFKYGSTKIRPVDLSVTDRSAGGQTYSEIKDIFYNVNGEFYWIDDTQGTKLGNLVSAVGTHTPFFLSIDPTNKPYDLLYYGKFNSLGVRTIEHTPGGYRWSIPFDFNEEL